MSKPFDELVQKSKDAVSFFNNTVATTLAGFVHSEATQRAADVADIGKENAERAEKGLHRDLAGVNAKKEALNRRIDYVESFKQRAADFVERHGHKPSEFKDAQFTKPMAEALDEKSSNIGAQIQKQSHVARAAGGSALMLNAAVGPILLAEGARELKKASDMDDGTLAVRGTARTVQGAAAVGTAVPAIKGLATGSKVLGPVGLVAGAVVSGSEAYDALREAQHLDNDKFHTAANYKTGEAAWRAFTAVTVPMVGVGVFAATAASATAPVWLPVVACVGVAATLSLVANKGAHIISDMADDAKKAQVTSENIEATARTHEDRPKTIAQIDSFASKLGKFRADREGADLSSAIDEPSRKFSR